MDGFLFVTGTGVSSATLQRNLAIAQHAVSGIPSQEKLPYAAKLDEGSYRGYKLRGIWKRDGGVPDNFEVWDRFGALRERALLSKPIALQP